MNCRYNERCSHSKIVLGSCRYCFDNFDRFDDVDIDTIFELRSPLMGLQTFEEETIRTLLHGFILRIGHRAEIIILHHRLRTRTAASGVTDDRGIEL